LKFHDNILPLSYLSAALERNIALSCLQTD
jgi:hypothetical protein